MIWKTGPTTPNKEIMSKKILIMAGGTGGHIFPALAIAKELSSRGMDIVWLGSKGGMEEKIVPKHGHPIHCIHSSGLRGKHQPAQKQLLSIFEHMCSEAALELH